jgi:hypothetical protein
MNAVRLLCLFLSLPLAGCLTPQERMAEAKARNDTLDDQTCQSYGAKPGTDIYIQCRMNRQQSRDAGDNAIAAAAAGAPIVTNNSVPTSDAPVLRNILPQQTRCQTIGMGRTMQTVCN